MSEIRKRIKAPAPDGWPEVAAAVREVRDQIRESFGPRQEVRLVTDEFPELIKSVHAFETRPEQEERLKREIRDRVLDLCGFVAGDEVTAGGSADNDLAHERADAVMNMLDQVRRHSFPAAVAPPPEGAPLYELLNALRPLVYRVVNATAADDAALTENVDVIMAFVNLAREHSDPKRLLPRGDRVGDWLPPGTEVTIFGRHAAVVVDEPGRVLVNMVGYPHPVSFPRSAVARKGEPWTPPKHTAD
jgi:hypothetical protein